MKTKRYFNCFMILSVSVLFVFSSCTEKIDLQLGNTYTRLVVDGAITTDTGKQIVKLKKSVDYYYNLRSPVISNAIVSITDGDSVYNLTENPTQPGTYETAPTVYGIAGKTYTLSIKNVDVNGDGVMEEYSATSLLNPIITADSIQVKDYVMPGNEKDTGWLINVYAKNRTGEAWFAFKVKKNQVDLSDSIHKWMSFIGYSDGSNAYINGSLVYMSDGTQAVEKLKDGDTISLEADGITKEYYNFINDYSQEYYAKSPIGSGPSSNISTNIEPADMAVGFFAAYSKTRKSKVFHRFKK
jgi:hypothetical protein